MSRLQQVGIMGSLRGLFSTCSGLWGLHGGASTASLLVGTVPSGTSGIVPDTLEIGPEVAPQELFLKWHLGNCPGSGTLEIVPGSGTSGIVLEVTPREEEVTQVVAGRKERGSPRWAQLSFGTMMGSKPSSCVGSVWAEGSPCP